MRHLVLHSLWLPTLLAAGYTLPLALTGGRPNGLRRIPLLKALIIGFVWASLLVVLPGTVEQNGMPFIPVEVWLLGFIWTCTIMAIAIAFDIRDLPHDPPSLRTVPQVLGPFGAKVVATLLLIPLFLLLLFLLVMGQGATGSGWRGSQLDLSLVLPALGVVGLAMLIIRSDPRRPWWYWDLLMDGALIVMPLLAWVGHQL